MSVSNIAIRARDQYTHALSVATEQLSAADRLPFGLARLPHFQAAGQYYAKAWGTADLMAGTCPSKDFSTWDARRHRALEGLVSCNRAITELVAQAVAA